MKNFSTAEDFDSYLMDRKMRKSRNFVAKDLRTPKYRMRVVSGEKVYNRQKEKEKFKRDLAYV